MATIKYFVRSKKGFCRIYVRFSVSREMIFKKVTPLIVNSEKFNNKTGKLRTKYESKEDFELKEELNKLSKRIITTFNRDKIENKSIHKQWFNDIVENHFNQGFNDESKLYLRNFAKKYIEELPNRANIKGGFGCAESTIVKYNTCLKKVIEYEDSRNRKIQISDINLNFREDFVKFLIKEQNLGKNTAGRYLVFVKTIGLYAKRNGILVSPQLELIRGFSVKVDKITLSFKEIKQIENTSFENESLESAKDWLIIGCYTGQRVSDLLRLTSKNIVFNDDLGLIELIQRKTNKKVSVLIHPKVYEILKKRNFNFPKIYSKNIKSASAVFNKLIKEVAYESGIRKEISGAKVNPKTNRKEKGIFPKFELITSHICRRSFATNFYGDIPTPLLINITGHSTEKEFLNYIGKASIDYAEQLAKYWNV